MSAAREDCGIMLYKNYIVKMLLLQWR